MSKETPTKPASGAKRTASVKLGEEDDIGADESTVTPVQILFEDDVFEARVFTDSLKPTLDRARFIVTAVNAFDPLVAALNAMSEAIDGLEKYHNRIPCHPDSRNHIARDFAVATIAQREARAALALADGRGEKGGE